MERWKVVAIHVTLISLAFLTLLPFFFTINNIFRTRPEFDRAFFSLPDCFKNLAQAITAEQGATFQIENEEGEIVEVASDKAIAFNLSKAGRGPRLAWRAIRPYMVNSLWVSAVTAFGVSFIGSVTAYVLARYRFFGSRLAFLTIISTMMFPGVLTLVPSFLLVKELGLLNTYWAMILPYIAGGQVFAIFVFRSFFSGLPEDLFESARIDGAGHFRIYWNLVLPLSKAAFSVVIIMNIIGTWNNFLWPFITNTEGKKHVVASGLFVLATSEYASNPATLYAAYAISSIPMLILFVYATKPFIRGMTSGAFKA